MMCYKIIWKYNQHFWVAGHIGSIFVRQKSRYLCGGGHVWLANRHHPKRVQDKSRASQRPQSRLQRRTIQLQKGEHFLSHIAGGAICQKRLCCIHAGGPARACRAEVCSFRRQQQNAGSENPPIRMLAVGIQVGR